MVVLASVTMTSAHAAEPVYMFDAIGRLPIDGPVVIEGILQQGIFLGAPAYGNEPQTDSQERWPYVQLPYPVQFERDPKMDTAQTTEDHPLYFVQLLLLPEHGGRPELFGEKVRITGRAMWGHTSHHRTPVVLSVESIERIRSFGLLKRRGSRTRG
jgi:uncharacterized protein DUF4431